MAILVDIWASLSVVHDEIYGLIFTLLGAFVFSLFRAKVKLTYGEANNSLNAIKVPSTEEGGIPSSTQIYVEKFFLQNAGTKTANNVEFVLSSWPTDISVYEPRKVQYTELDKGQCLIEIPQIAPRELVIIDCAYINQQAAWIVSVKCAEALGKKVDFWTVRRFSGWVNSLIFLSMILGCAFFIQLAFKLLF